METVSFYSYKGGVGRTLLVANTAQFLAVSGRRVVVLDLDLEAPGLHQKLGNREALRRAERGTLKGAVDELLLLFGDEPRKSRLREIAIKVDLPSGTNGSLFLIAAGSAPSHAYWAALERLNNLLRTHRRSGSLLEAVLELQARIAEEFSPDFLLIDSRTGITELGGLATSILADRVLCLTTTAPESVEGTLVVADAMKNAPRLSSQQPLRIEFLITRVISGSSSSSNVSQVIKQLGGSATVLPHDSGISNEEQVLTTWRPTKSDRSDDYDSSGTELFSATLEWIARSFPVHKQEAEAACQRMEAVHNAWRYLTRTTRRIHNGTGSRAAWPVEQLAERVSFKENGESRQADIVVYDGPPQKTISKPLMIIEYANKEDCDTIARWWLTKTKAQVVAILSNNSDRKLYSRKNAWDSRARHSERWDLPLPHDFENLSDPTDVSIDALLDSVLRGHAEHLERIVREWVRCSAAGLHGGMPWKPEIAKKIVDALAQVNDVELARRILWKAAESDDNQDKFEDGFSRYSLLDEQVIAELFVPLLWRLPPAASIEHLGRRHRDSSGVAAISLLARNILGLKYDPDATFRLEAHRILARAENKILISQDNGIYGLAPAFRNTEISFETSSDLPPLAVQEVGDNQDQKREDLNKLMIERIAARSLVTTGLLGNYQAHQGRVILYDKAIALCADKLTLKARHIGSVVLIHETIHALVHLGRDLDGRMWTEFALPEANNPLFEPSWFHEVLTQYFTYQHIIQLKDPALQYAFEAMSTKQTPAYRVWKRLRHTPVEDVRNWFMSVRRGMGIASSSAHLIFDAMHEEDDVL